LKRQYPTTTLHGVTDLNLKHHHPESLRTRIKEEHRLRVTEKMILRRIFGPEREEVTRK
jgi:hypothetical protein